jgi:hypothetical protein
MLRKWVSRTYFNPSRTYLKLVGEGHREQRPHRGWGQGASAALRWGEMDGIFAA